MVLDLSIQEEGLQLKAELIPWDTDVFGFPIAQLSDLIVEDSTLAFVKFEKLNQWASTHGIKMINCRLPHEQLKESFFLEEQGFRFIEMVLHPVMENLQDIRVPDSVLQVREVPDYEVALIQDMAEKCFAHERFHMDPRLNTELANVRYGRWVTNSTHSSSQLLLKIEDGSEIVAFFVIELTQNKRVYWHLTAVTPEFQGRGYGRKAWLAMLGYHQANGVKQVSTTISARNTRVLNLYSQLHFRFTPPEMTFHLMVL